MAFTRASRYIYVLNSLSESFVMVYAVGIFGFLMGFGLGQILLLKILKGKTNTEILHNKSLRLKYGLLNWGLAIMGCYGAVRGYEFFMLQ